MAQQHITVPLHTYRVQCETQSVTEANIINWIQKAGRDLQFTYMLAHATDGVIWGRWDNGELVTSFDVANERQRKTFCAALRDETLQQARLFGQNHECLLWRDDLNQSWSARLLSEQLFDSETEELEGYDEQHIMWGTKASSIGNTDFSLLEDGAQGLRHIIPIQPQFHVPQRSTALVVRHYLKTDPITGFVSITYSRLVDITEVS